MSSSYSILHNYTQELYRPNLELASTVMQSKQGALDANRAQLKTISDRLGILDIAKEGDQEYAEERLKQARSIVDQYASGDISDSNLTGQLISKLGETVDDTVMNAVASTARYRSEQSAWQKLKQDSPEKYSELNHAYANQSSNAWLNDEQVGSNYRGGGGVIEHVDLSKKILSNLPKLQDSLKAEWVQTGPQQGYFRSMDTYEAVDRNAMRGALDLLLDDKDRKQINIDAWGQYENASDEQLKAAYDGYFSPRMDETADRLNAAKLALSKATTDNDVKHLTSVVEKLEQDNIALSSNTYDNLVASSGRQAAYSTLHSAQFKNGILDTYSYGPRLTERKIDAVQQANANYELKLRSLAETQRHNQTNEAISAAKAQAQANRANSSGAKNPDGTPVSGPQRGKQIVIDNKGTAGDFVGEMYAAEDRAYSAVVDIFENAGLSKGDLNSPEFKAQIENLEGRSYITVNGKKIDVAENFAELEDYKQRVATQSKEKAQVYEQVDSILDKAEKTLRFAARYKGSVNLYDEVPNFNFQLVDDGKGGLKYKYLKYDGKTNLYAHLLKNEPKTEAGKSTLKLQRALHLMNDGNLSESDRRVVKDYTENLLSTMPANVRKQINLEVVTGKGKRIKNSHTKVSQVSDLWMSEFTLGDVQWSLYSQQAADDFNNGVSFADSTEEERVAFGERFAEAGGLKDIKLANGTTRTDTQGLDFMLKDQFGAINRKLSDAHAATDGKLSSSYQQIFSSDDAGYEDIKAQAGLLDEKFSNNFSIEQEFNEEGVATERVKIKYQTKSTAAQIEDGAGTYTTHQAFANKSALPTGVTDPFDVQRLPYDARQGARAKTISLGNHRFDDDHVLTTNREEFPNPIFTDEVIANKSAEIRQELGDYGKRYLYAMDLFEKGSYTFSMEPNKQGTYSVKIMLGDEKKGVFPTPFTTFSNEERRALHLDPRAVVENAFASYLNRIENEAIKEQAKNQ